MVFLGFFEGPHYRCCFDPNPFWLLDLYYYQLLGLQLLFKCDINKHFNCFISFMSSNTPKLPPS